MIRVSLLFCAMSLGLWGCSTPDYIAAPPADPAGLDRRLAPSWPERALVRDQHLGALHTEWRFLEEALFRAEQDRINACRHPEAAEVNTLAQARCQWQDQLYERRKGEVAQARAQYLHALSASGVPAR